MFQYHKQLRSFHAVASKGGFTAAAHYLNIGQPTVTEQVRDLEERFSIELFFRRGKTVELSPAGEQLFAVTQGMFGQEEEAMQLLQNLTATKAGRLRVGAVSPPLSIELIDHVRQQFPDTRVELSILSEQEALNHLIDFKIDIGVLARVSDDGRLHVLPFQSHRIIAVVNRKHPLASYKSISLRELARHDLVLREPESKTRQVVESAAREHGVDLKPVYEINSREAIFHAVKHGLGIGVVNELEFLADPDLRAVPLERGRVKIEYYLCCLSARRERPVISSLMQYAHRQRH